MKVFMLGWEFPPHISGGLGTACHGLTRGLDRIGVEVAFVLPKAVGLDASNHVKFRTPAQLAEALQAESDEAAPPSTGKPGAGHGEAWTEQVERVYDHVELHRLPAALQAYARPAEDRVRATRRKIRQTGTRRGKRPGREAEASDQPSPSTGAPTVDEILSAGAPSDKLVPGAGEHYAGDLFGQIQRYARLAVELAVREEFDVIHAHDWMTCPAAVAVKAACRKPMVFHVHSTEFDRSGDNINQQIYDIERMGMHAADRVVCVSHLTRNIVRARYGVDARKVDVVYNAVEAPDVPAEHMPPIGTDEKIVLFLGRVTMQKGPEYFLRAAKKVVEKFRKVRFVVAGSGDMITRCIEEAAALGIGRYVTFTGFLRGRNVDRIFQMADLYVMPSVSEPFGIAPLEAISHNVPVIISKQSGVSEVLTHALKVDFWDTDEMANKILAVLRHPPLQRTLRQHGQFELAKLSWRDSAEKVAQIYRRLVAAS